MEPENQPFKNRNPTMHTTRVESQLNSFPFVDKN